jgi:hypothetical protein
LLPSSQLLPPSGLWGLFLVLIIAGLGNADVAPSVANASVLKIALNRPIVDYKGGSGDDPFSVLFEETIALDEVVASVQAAAEDDRISGISFETPFFSWGMESSRNPAKRTSGIQKFRQVYLRLWRFLLSEIVLLVLCCG